MQLAFSSGITEPGDGLLLEEFVCFPLSLWTLPEALRGRTWTPQYDRDTWTPGSCGGCWGRGKHPPGAGTQGRGSRCGEWLSTRGLPDRGPGRNSRLACQSGRRVHLGVTGALREYAGCTLGKTT